MKPNSTISAEQSAATELNTAGLDTSQFIDHIFAPDEVVALTVLHAGKGASTGYFKDRGKFYAEVERRSGYENLYVNLNPVKDEVYQFAPDRIVPGIRYDAGDIVRRRAILIDCDPVRPAKTNSTEIELQGAIAKAKCVQQYLFDRWGVGSLLPTSGNGCHLYYLIDEPTDTKLVKQVLDHLSEKFSDHNVTIDTAVCDAPRITRLPGTWNVKAKHTDDRPNRLAAILTAPDDRVIVTTEQLIELVGQAEAAKARTSSGSINKADVIDALNHLDAECANDRKTWFSIICAVHSVDPDDSELLEAVIKWSEQSIVKHKPGEVEKFWAKCKPDGKITVATLFKYARDNGWKPTKSNQSRVSNYIEIPDGTDKDGNPLTKIIPKHINDIVADVHRVSGDWPRRCGGVVFVDDPKHGLRWFDRERTAGVFSWLKSGYEVSWRRVDGGVTQSELVSQLDHVAKQYRAIELLPHEPMIDGIYYRCETPEPGDGKHLEALIDRFRPATNADRQLIKALFITPFWGGPPGARPAFVITSDEGRGAGKTKLAQFNAQLAGGAIAFETGADCGGMKTRLLSAEGQTKRIAMLDNIKSLRLSWAQLEELITTTNISGHQMYVGEGQRPNVLTWMLTLNGVSMSEDMAQRSVVIKLKRGANDGGWEDSTREFIETYRQEIIAAIVGVLRTNGRKLKKYSRWAAWESGVLSKLEVPTGLQTLIGARQREINTDALEGEMIEDHFAAKLEENCYVPRTGTIRIPVATIREWYCEATGDKARAAGVTVKLKQLIKEGQLNKLSVDSGRTHGRCYIWTGEDAQVNGVPDMFYPKPPMHKGGYGHI